MIAGNAVSTGTDPASGTGPFSFTVPKPPPGRFLFSVVLCNDLHIGETVAGRAGDIPGLTGVSQVPGHPPYPEVMFRSLVQDATQLGANFLLAAGDITAEAEPVDLRTARRMLDRFGERHTDWFLTRGNHDRAHEGEPYAACSVGRWQGNDCFVDEFFPDGDATWVDVRRQRRSAAGAVRGPRCRRRRRRCRWRAGLEAPPVPPVPVSGRGRHRRVTRIRSCRWKPRGILRSSRQAVTAARR
jgi:hypothetical protein